MVGSTKTVKLLQDQLNGSGFTGSLPEGLSCLDKNWSLATAGSLWETLWSLYSFPFKEKIMSILLQLA